MDCFGFFVILIFVACFLTLVFNIAQEIKNYVDHKRFIDSIKVGDVFEFSPVDEDNDLNPFYEQINTRSSYCTIVDMKESNYGTKYVQYVYDENPDLAHTKFSDTLENFLHHRKRIKHDETK